MARILPDTPPRSASSEVVKVFQSLKRLPDDYEVWHNMGFQKQKAPDFLLVRERLRPAGDGQRGHGP